MNQLGTREASINDKYGGAGALKKGFQSGCCGAENLLRLFLGSDWTGTLFYYSLAVAEDLKMVHIQGYQ